MAPTSCLWTMLLMARLMPSCGADSDVDSLKHEVHTLKTELAATRVQMAQMQQQLQLLQSLVPTPPETAFHGAGRPLVPVSSLLAGPRARTSRHKDYVAL